MKIYRTFRLSLVALATCYFALFFPLSQKLHSHEGATHYVEQAQLLGSSGSEQGYSVSISADGNTLAVGGPGSSPSDKGSVLLFTRSKDGWSRQQQIDGSCASGSFGRSVSLTPDSTIVAVGEPTCASGTVYLYTWSGNTWKQQQQITAADTVGNSYFGLSISLSADGNTIAIGGPFDSSNGAVWIFTQGNNVWTEQQKITPPPGALAFGESVSLSADGISLAIGAPGTVLSPSSGDAYIYVLSGNQWELQKAFAAPDTTMKCFGKPVTLTADGTCLAISSGIDILNASSKSLSNAAVWIYTTNGDTWTEQQQITVSDSIGDSGFNNAQVAFSNSQSVLIAGGHLDNSTVGAIWVFEKSGNLWTEQQKIVPSVQQANEAFGCTVSISANGSTIVVGSPFINNDNGSAWVYVND
jgi:hypothetical protein